jgi:hypothetical protein
LFRHSTSGAFWNNILRLSASKLFLSSINLIAEIIIFSNLSLRAYNPAATLLLTRLQYLDLHLKIIVGAIRTPHKSELTDLSVVYYAAQYSFASASAFAFAVFETLMSSDFERLHCHDLLAVPQGWVDFPKESVQVKNCVNVCYK